MRSAGSGCHETGLRVVGREKYLRLQFSHKRFDPIGHRFKSAISIRARPFRWYRKACFQVARFQAKNDLPDEGLLSTEKNKTTPAKSTMPQQKRRTLFMMMTKITSFAKLRDPAHHIFFPFGVQANHKGEKAPRRSVLGARRDEGELPRAGGRFGRRWRAAGCRLHPPSINLLS